MTCQCQSHRRDSIEALFSGQDGKYSGILRKADQELPYPMRGTVEYAPAGDLGEIQVGAPVELEHDGPVVGRVIGVRRDSKALIVDFQIDPEHVQLRKDLDDRKIAHLSADYRVGRLDSDGAQREVVISRVAITTHGRCGDACSVLRSDSHMSDKTKTESAPENKPAPDTAESESMRRRLDALETENKRLRASESKRIRGVADQVARKAGVKVEIRKDADDSEVMASTIQKIAPSVDLANASPDFIAGAFAVAIAMVLEKADMADSKEKPPAESGEDAGPPAAAGASDARADAMDHRETAKRRDAVDPDEDVPPDVIARRKAVDQGRSFKP